MFPKIFAYKTHSLQKLIIICRKAVVFLFRNNLDAIQSHINSIILIGIVLIAIFEFFVDIPVFKEAGMVKDVRITTIINIVFLISALALFVIILL